ncbi:MAG: sugar phosphate isomerase/epimerase [Armatimonadota bacterium]|nr:MAG: sugar phosphate isomerase/epimerase [Armatimonadota bacterium]
MKIGLYTISFAGVWYDGPALPLGDIFKRAKSMGFDGVEIGARRPHASPMDLDENAREKIRKQAADAGLEIPAVAGYNNFASPILEQRENELLMVREQIKLARDLGAPVLRLFAAWRGITLRDGHGTYDITRQYWQHGYPDVTGAERWRWVTDCLRETADFAGDMGVTLALQNHEPVIRDHLDMLQFIREVDSPALKACLDCPLLTQQDGEYVTNAVRVTGDLQVHSHYGGEFEEQNGEVVQRQIRFARRSLINYPAFIKALKEIGYQGYLCYEFCHPCLGENHELLGVEEVAEQVALAQRYMRNLVG